MRYYKLTLERDTDVEMTAREVADWLGDIPGSAEIRVRPSHRDDGPDGITALIATWEKR